MMKTMTKTMTGLVMVALFAGGARRAQAQGGASLPDTAKDTIEKVQADLEAIDNETKNAPGAASERIHKIVERARGRLAKLTGGKDGVPPPAAGWKPGTAGPASDAKASGGAPVAPGPSAAAKKGGPMAADQFKELVKLVKSQSFDGARLSAMKNTVDGGAFLSAAQIAGLVHWIGSSDVRVEAAAVLYSHCTDPANYSAVYSKLDSDASRKELRARIEGGK